MEQQNTPKKDSRLLNLILGSILLVLGLGVIITAYVLNYHKSPFADSPKYIYAMYIIGAIVMFIGACDLYYGLQMFINIKKMSIKQMSVISIMAALSVILYYYAKFSIKAIFPSWLDFQFSDVPALITTFIYGPLSGGLLIIIRFIVKLPATMTAGVGELADLIIGLTLTTVSGLIYKKHHSFKGALCAMAIGMASATAMAVFANWAILIPAYIHIAGFKMYMLVGGMSYIKGINDNNFMAYYLTVGVIPFNILRYLMVFVITLVLYKRLHILIEKFTE